MIGTRGDFRSKYFKLGRYNRQSKHIYEAPGRTTSHPPSPLIIRFYYFIPSSAFLVFQSTPTCLVSWLKRTEARLNLSHIALLREALVFSFKSLCPYHFQQISIWCNEQHRYYRIVKLGQCSSAFESISTFSFSCEYMAICDE